MSTDSSQSARSSRRSPIALLRMAVVLSGAVLLVWFTGKQALAAVAARSDNPVLLAQFDPAIHPAAGAQLTQAHLAAEQYAAAVRVGRQAVLADPMNVRPMRILGTALQAIDEPASTRILRTAERLGWRDTPLSLWAVRDAATQGDPGRVMDWIDALSRRQVRPEITKFVLIAGLDDAVSRRYLADHLRRNPEWRGSFFFGLIRNELPEGSLSKAALLMDELDKTDAPTNPIERMALVERMVDTGNFSQAQTYWKDHFDLPATASASVPFDSAFRSVATRGERLPLSPFEWQMPPEADSFVYFREGAKSPVLQIDPGARGGSAMIAQLMSLSPGTYRIDTSLEAGDNAQSPVEWMVYCLPSNQALLRSFATRNNELSGVGFTVPQQGCEGQRLVLAARDRLDARALAISSVTIH